MDDSEVDDEVKNEDVGEEVGWMTMSGYFYALRASLGVCEHSRRRFQQSLEM